MKVSRSQSARGVVRVSVPVGWTAPQKSAETPRAMFRSISASAEPRGSGQFVEFTAEGAQAPERATEPPGHAFVCSTQILGSRRGGEGCVSTCEYSGVRI